MCDAVNAMYPGDVEVWRGEPVIYEGKAYAFLYNVRGEIYAPQALVASTRAMESNIDADNVVNHPENRRLRFVKCVPEALRYKAAAPSQSTRTAVSEARVRLEAFRVRAYKFVEALVDATTFRAGIDAVVTAFRELGTTSARATAVVECLCSVEGGANVLSASVDIMRKRDEHRYIVDGVVMGAGVTGAKTGVLPTDPDWRPSDADIAEYLSRVSVAEHVVPLVNAMRKWVPSHLDGSKKNGDADAVMSNMPNWDNWVSKAVTRSTYDSKRKDQRALLNVWDVLIEQLEAHRSDIATELKGLLDYEGRPLVKLFRLDEPFMTTRPDAIEFIRKGFVAMIARQLLRYTWRVGQAPKPDQMRPLFTSAAGRKGGESSHKDWEQTKACNFAIGLKNRYAGSTMYREIELLDKFYGRLFALWAVRPKTLPKKLDMVYSGPMTWMFVSATVQRMYETLISIDGEVTVRVAEAQRQFISAALLAGFISQGRSGDIDYISKPGGGCIHPNCSDRSRCMGVRFLDAGHTVVDSGGRRYTASKPILLQTHYKRDSETDPDEVHMVDLPADLAAALKLWVSKGRCVLQEHHRTITTECDTLLLSQQGGRVSDRARQIIRDITFSVSRLLGLENDTGNWTSKLVDDMAIAEVVTMNDELFIRFKDKIEPEWNAFRQSTCGTDYRKVFLSCRDDEGGLTRWAHEAWRIHQKDKGEPVVGLKSFDPAENSLVWDFVVSRSAKTSLTKRRVNYTRGLPVHNMMAQTYGLIRRFFVMEDRSFLPYPRGMHAREACGEKREMEDECDTACSHGTKRNKATSVHVESDLSDTSVNSQIEVQGLSPKPG